MAWLKNFPIKTGVRTSSNPIVMNVFDISDMSNFYMTTDFVLRQRPGQSTYNVSDDAVDLNNSCVKAEIDFFFIDSDGRRKQILVKVKGGKVLADNENNGVFTDITGSFIIDSDDRVTWEIFGNRLILCFENSRPKMWTGSGNIQELSSNAPNGSLVRKHANRLWISGVKASPHKIFYSNAFQPTVWTGLGTGSLELDPDDEDPVGVTALFPSARGEYYVAKQSSIYQVAGYTPSTFQVFKIIDGIGCIEHNTAVFCQNDVLFCTQYGVHSLVAAKSGFGVDTDMLSFPVHNLFLDGSVNLRRSKVMNGFYYKDANSYILLYPSGAKQYPDNAILFNFILKQWFKWEGFNVSSLVNQSTFYTPSRNRVLCGRNDGHVSILDNNVNTDLGGEIDAWVEFGSSYLNSDPTMGFKGNNLLLSYFISGTGSASIDMSYRVNDVEIEVKTFSRPSSSTPLGAFTLGEDSLGHGYKQITKSYGIRGVGSTFYTKFEKDSGGTPLGEFTLGSDSLINGDTTISINGWAVDAEVVTINKDMVKIQ